MQRLQQEAPGPAGKAYNDYVAMGYSEEEARRLSAPKNENTLGEYGKTRRDIENDPSLTPEQKKAASESLLTKVTGGAKEITDAQRIMALDKIASIKGDVGVDESNVAEINAMLRAIGEPTYKKVDVPGKKRVWPIPDGEPSTIYEQEAPPASPQGSTKGKGGGLMGGGRTLEGSMIQAESGGDQNAVSRKGATGATQLMPGTAKDLGVNPKDHLENVAGGVSYLTQLRNKYGDDETALIAYNWGPGNTDEWLRAGGDKTKLPRETKAYVSKVLSNVGPASSIPSEKPAGLMAGEAQAEQAPKEQAPAAKPASKPTPLESRQVGERVTTAKGEFEWTENGWKKIK